MRNPYKYVVLLLIIISFIAYGKWGPAARPWLPPIDMTILSAYGTANAVRQKQKKLSIFFSVILLFSLITLLSMVLSSK